MVIMFCPAGISRFSRVLAVLHAQPAAGFAGRVVSAARAMSRLPARGGWV